MAGVLRDVPATGRDRRVMQFGTPVEPAELPARFPSPFDRGAVHPLARRAATEMLDALRAHAPPDWNLDGPDGGKMFGVLVVEDADGRVGYLRGFSGMLAGSWTVPGWVPPAFDIATHDALRIAAAHELQALASSRHARVNDGVTAAELSSFDKGCRERANVWLRQLQATYRFASATGTLRTLAELFRPGLPPGGAGDCAAPKLLAHAHRHALRPVALVEVWWGAMPRSGDRRAGSLYPACRGKCAPILSHLLDGLSADPPPLFGGAFVPANEPVVVFEDSWLAIVEKPCGMLSVPGRSAHLHDSVSTRLRERFPDATGPLLVHRLDLDTSGLLLVAKDAGTYASLQRLFANRAITKRYIAWLDGEIVGERGTIDLALRVDVDDRPRQIHDPVHGKHAITHWRVLAREAGRTRVEFLPYTGRTHQLRVHAAHPHGLNAPIVGDPLYGREAPSEGERLMLHAECLAFVHPVTGERISMERPAPF